MAGAGYRQFADGDVLTAAQVQTFLQDQAVMRFGDSSARDAALGTAVSEGMVAYLDDTDEVQVYDGTAWGGVGLALGTATPTDGQFLSFGTATSTWNPVDAPGNAGIGSNVVQTVKTNTFSTSSSFTDVTGLSVTITPTSATAKLLLVANVAISNSDNGGRSRYELTDSSNAAVLGSGSVDASFSPSSSQNVYRQTTVALVSPATTSPVTYKVRAGKIDGSLCYINRNGTNNATTYSTLTAIEVAA